MSKSYGRLGGYPKLLAWYQLHKDIPVDQPVRHFVWATCRALSLPHESMPQAFMGSLRAFLAVSTKYREDFVNVEDSFASGGVAFFELVSEIAEAAMTHGHGHDFATLMSEAAERTSLTPFRFLSAWSFLNINDWEKCIAECEKVHEPFAPIYTLQGQAYLEQGYPQESIQLLEIALKISPREILAAFQLAKAYHVLGDFAKTWFYLELCQTMAPQSIEVLCFKAMACLTLTEVPQDCKLSAWQDLYRQSKQWAAQPSISAYLMQLALDLGDEDKFARVMEHVDLPALKSDGAFLPHVAHILKKLHQNGWQQTQLRFLDSITA